MDEQVRRFREQARRANVGRRGTGRRYGKVLRQEAVSYARQCRGRGESWGRIAERLGVPAATLLRWAQEASAASFRPVEIREEPGEVAEPEEPSLVWITPRGHRIEGLSLEAVSALLEGLG